MDKIRIRKLISNLAKRDYRRMYMNDFFLTWEKTDDEIAATFLVAIREEKDYSRWQKKSEIQRKAELKKKRSQKRQL